MPNLSSDLSWLKTFTQEVIASTPEPELMAMEILSNLTGRNIVPDPSVDIDTFAARFGERSAEIKVVLKAVQALKKPAPVVPERPSFEPPPPRWPSPARAEIPTPAKPQKPITQSAARIAPRPPPDSDPSLCANASPAPGHALLCAVSQQVPTHAMLGHDGCLYDRDGITDASVARSAVPDHTMTAAINAWREHGSDPQACLTELRAAVQCPITMEVPQDPVLAADGFTYEGVAIAAYLLKTGAHAGSPVTGLPLQHTRLVPNTNLTRLIRHRHLAEADGSDWCDTSRYCYIGHPRLGIFAILPEGAHREVFASVHACLDALYAKAPLTTANRAEALSIAQQGYNLLQTVFAAYPDDGVRRIARKLRAELNILTARWQLALQDLEQAGEPTDAFDYSRRMLALQALKKHDEAARVKHEATRNGLLQNMLDTCESCACLGESLRHKRHYALAEQVLLHALTLHPNTSAAQSLKKARSNMKWRWLSSRPMSGAEMRAAIASAHV